jgi:hypothetical protein
VAKKGHVLPVQKTTDHRQYWRLRSSSVAQTEHKASSILVLRRISNEMEEGVAPSL